MIALASAQKQSVVPTRGQQLLPLTGLRFVAALLVVMHHYCMWWVFPTFPGVPIEKMPMSNIIYSGFMGVDFFFVLSGFILAYTYLNADGQMRGSRRSFWVARIARIYPVYLVAFALAVAYHYLQPVHQPVVKDLMTGTSMLTLTEAWFPQATQAFNPPGWTLSAEAFFYLLFPIVAGVVGRLTRRQLYLTLVTCYVIILVASVVYVVSDPDHVSNTWVYNNGSWEWIMRLSPLLRLPEFIMGAVLGRLFILQSQRPVRTAHWLTPGVYALLSAGAIIIVMSYGLSLPYPMLNQGVLDPLFGLLIYSFAQGRGMLAKFFSLPLLVLLGEASYALYILQVPLWSLMIFTLKVTNTSAYYTQGFFVVYLGVALGISILALYLIERPARRLIRRAASLGQH